MTTSHINIDHVSAPHGGTKFFDCGRACVRSKTDIGLTVISISGEIDAANVGLVGRHACELLSDGAVIVDFGNVDFISVDGLGALVALNNKCARTGTTLALIASHAMNRLLRVADHDKLLPAVGSAVEALLLVRRSNLRDDRAAARQ